MQIGNFQDMYFADLSELRSAELQIAEALSKMADAVRHAELKQALLDHRELTRSQQARVEEILRKHGQEPGMHQDQAMQALIHEGEKMVAILTEPNLRDAGIIASAQRIEHYEIAGYGTAAAHAGVLGFEDDRTTLHEILEEKKATDELLTTLAKTVVNVEAAGR